MLAIYMIVFFSIILVDNIIGPFAPENYIYFLILVLIIIDRNFRETLNQRYTLLLALLLFIYPLVKNAYSLVIEGEISDPFGSVVRSLLLLFAIASISAFKDYKTVVKLLAYSILASGIFGLLIHYYGEPFTSLRMSLIVDPTPDNYFTKGMRVVGFSRRIHLFGYPLSVLPMLLLYLFKDERKIIHLVFLFVSILVIILNGERAPLIFSGIMLIYLLRRYYKMKVKSYLIIVPIAIIFYLGIQRTINIPEYDEFEHGIARLSEEQEKENIISRASKQLIAIYVSFKTPLQRGDVNEYNEIFKVYFGHYPTIPHNMFVNMGFWVGIWGWIIAGLYFYYVYKILKKNKKIINTSNPRLKYLYDATLTSFISITLVSFTHNQGVFTSERTSIIILALLLVPYNIYRKSLPAS